MRPFTNVYTPRKIPDPTLKSAFFRCAPTSSTIPPLLRELDALCDTKLSNLIQRAELQGRSPSYLIRISNCPLDSETIPFHARTAISAGGLRHVYTIPAGASRSSSYVLSYPTNTCGWSEI